MYFNTHDEMVPLKCERLLGYVPRSPTSSPPEAELVLLHCVLATSNEF